MRAANPYVQALLTYPRRVRPSVTLGVIGLVGLAGYGLMVVGIVWANDPPARNLVPLHLTLFFFGGVFLACQITEQFADPRSRLMPGFRRPHLVAAAVPVFLLAAVFPAVVTWLAGLKTVALVAYAVAIVATALWVIPSPISWSSLFILIAWLALLISLDMRKMVAGEGEPAAYALLVVGMAALGGAARRFCRLPTDSPAWGRYWVAAGRVTPLLVVRWPYRWRLWCWLSDKRTAGLLRHARRTATSPWSRVCRWQVGMIAGVYVWLWAVGCALFLLVPQCLSRDWDRGLLLLMSPCCMIVVPAIAPPLLLARRLQTLGTGLVLPVERGAWLRQFGVAAALSHLQLWAAITFVVGLLFLLFPAAGGSVSTVTFPEIVAISGFYQIWSFGASAALQRHPIGGGAITGMAVIATQLPMYFSSFRFYRQLHSDPPKLEPMTIDWPPGTLWVVGFLAILGVLLAWRAYRRWLVADIN